MLEKLKAEGLFGFEIPKQIKLDTVIFALRGLLTPTFKLKRHEAKKFYEKDIQELYAKKVAE